MRVRDIMTAPVATLDPSDSLAFAEELMNVERVRHLPVVDGDVLVGLVSHRDLTAASISTLSNPSDEDDLERKRRVQVREIMRGAVETVSPDDDAVRPADLMLSLKVGCVPVVDERHHLMGIVTESDYVRVAREQLARRLDAARGERGRARLVAGVTASGAATEGARERSKPRAARPRAEPAERPRSGASPRKRTAKRTGARGGARRGRLGR